MHSKIIVDRFPGSFILTRMTEKRRRNVEKKIFEDSSGGTGKPGPCLGPDCDKQIMRTKKIWLCQYCRKKISEIEGEAGVFIGIAAAKAQTKGGKED